jgi:hypothetical protein
MKAFDYSNLDFWFQPKNHLFKHFEQYKLGTNKKQRRLFFDNGGKVLLVAHIDTVQPPKIHRISRKTIHAQGLDDRLGCAIGHWIMQYLPVDLLLCDYEESGASTAQYHDVKESYNFIIELDRGGTDFVDYGGLAETSMMDDIETSSGMKSGWGSFSDICFLDCKGIGAVNWGIGYWMAHSTTSLVSKKNIQKQVRRLWEFIDTFQDRPYKEGVRVRGYGLYGIYGNPTSLDDGYFHKGQWYNKATAATGNEQWYSQSCDWCGNAFDVALMDNHVCVACQKKYPELYKYENLNTDDLDQCDICRELVNKGSLYNGLCPDCCGLHTSTGICKGCDVTMHVELLYQGLCQDCEDALEGGMTELDDDTETYNVMLDGKNHPVTMKKL